VRVRAQNDNDNANAIGNNVTSRMWGVGGAMPYRFLTTRQIELVRQSFDSIHRRDFAKIFYRRFFELVPHTRALFPSDLEGQYLTLMNMLAAIVGVLDNRDLFQSMTNYAGVQHARFGAKPADFSAFGEALIWCLQQQFGSTFTPELRVAWITLYDAVQERMINSAERAA
jgi:hemoglobin-like flavoprotein